MKDELSPRNDDSGDVYESVFGNIEAIVYRRSHDNKYTMEFLSGQVAEISGYTKHDLLDNAAVSWVGIIEPDDIDGVTNAVDEALDTKTPWEIAYRIVSKDGAKKWVREHGHGVFEDGELKCLQGLIVAADAEMAMREESDLAAKRASDEAKSLSKLAEQIMASLSKLSMLAVNARIEAARSGAAGLGFAVVAEEMSSLAQENAVFAKELTDQVNTGSDKPKRNKRLNIA